MSGAYNRIRSQPSRAPNSEIVQQMEAQGRRPFVDQFGKTVFGSVPGAPSSSRDTMTGLGVAVPFGQEGHNEAWQSFFRRPAAPQVDSSTGSVDPNDDSGMKMTTPQQQIQQSVQANQGWLSGQNVSYPAPPPLFNTQTNQVSFPTNDPAQFKSAFTGPNGVNAGYANRVAAYNSSLYQPADTKQAPVQPPNPAVVPPAALTGYVTTSPAQMADIAKRYTPSS